MGVLSWFQMDLALSLCSRGSICIWNSSRHVRERATCNVSNKTHLRMPGNQLKKKKKKKAEYIFYRE